MPLNPKHEIYIVGVNVDRYVVYRGSKSKDANSEPAVVKICQGVYMQNGLDAESVFNRYGLRIAHYLTPSATISFSTAWHKAPKIGRVFVTGQYQYVRPLFRCQRSYNIVQSVGRSSLITPSCIRWKLFAIRWASSRCCATRLN